MILEREEEKEREIEREREKERERETCERNIDWLPCTHPNQGSNPNLGMCPDWESNLQPFSVQDYAPTNQTTQPTDLEECPPRIRDIATGSQLHGREGQ